MAAQDHLSNDQFYGVTNEIQNHVSEINKMRGVDRMDFQGKKTKREAMSFGYIGNTGFDHKGSYDERHWTGWDHTRKSRWEINSPGTGKDQITPYFRTGDMAGVNQALDRVKAIHHIEGLKHRGA